MVGVAEKDGNAEFLKNMLRNAFDRAGGPEDRKSTRLNSSHGYISYAVFCLKKKKNTHIQDARSCSPKYALFSPRAPTPTTLITTTEPTHTQAQLADYSSTSIHHHTTHIT